MVLYTERVGGCEGVGGGCQSPLSPISLTRSVAHLPQLPLTSVAFSFWETTNSFGRVNWRVFVNLYFADELVNEKEKYKSITDELDQTFSELSGY